MLNYFFFFFFWGCFVEGEEYGGKIQRKTKVKQQAYIKLQGHPKKMST